MTIEIDSIPGSPVIGALNGDITDLETDVIVNSANTEMVLGGRRSVAGRINQLTDGRLERILADPNEFQNRFVWVRYVLPKEMCFLAIGYFISPRMEPSKK